MDRVLDYKQILRNLLEHLGSFKPSHGEIETEVIIDEQLGHYELVHSGWSNGHRIHGSALHIDLRDGKVWIQYDGIDEGVADRLVEAGIPKEDIILAFHPERVRHVTGFGVK